MAFRLEIVNKQRARRFDLLFIRRLADAARSACRDAVLADTAPLCRLSLIEATILGNKRIAAVHQEFFADPTPTDVITFQHGEILLGAEVIAENAGRYRRTVDEEASLCLIHGMLHLAGWDDLRSADAKKMARRQEQIFKLARKMI
jgi:probable rRNA maturation factor